MTCRTLRCALLLWILIPLVPSTHAAVAATPGDWTHAISVTGKPKYPPGFKHFDYANPRAPKRCTWRQPANGTTFDTLNPYTIKGRPSLAAYRYVYESLMMASQDEILTAYPWVASRLRFGPGDEWVEFDLHTKARWHDGVPLRVRDLIFSARVLQKHGRPFYRNLLSKVRLEKVSDLRVRVHLPATRARRVALSYSTLPILPAHWWKSRNFDDTILEPLMGSGPYRIAVVDPGRRIEVERVRSYWGARLAVMRGRHNFDRVILSYVRDKTARFEMFLRGDLHSYVDDNPRHWASAYDVEPVRQGRIRKIEIRNWFPVGFNGFFFNLRRAKFADRRVRRALILLFDFEWSNRVLFHGAYSRTRSYFQNTDIAAVRPPDDRELETLRRYAAELPPEALRRAYRPPVSDGSGRDRTHIVKAVRLLKDAGWRLEDGTLVHSQTGRPFRFVVLAQSPRHELVLGHWFKALERIGIDARMRVVDRSVFQGRLAKRDFDVIQRFAIPPLWPGGEQRSRWRSNSKNNYSGLESTAADALVDRIAAAKDYPSAVFNARLLDRVLQWHYLAVPNHFAATRKIAVWDRFARPPQPKYAWGTEFWWCTAKE